MKNFPQWKNFFSEKNDHLSFPYSFCLTLFSFVLPAYRELDLPVSGPRGGQCHHRYGRRRVVACQLYGQLHRHPHLVLGGCHLLYRRHARRHDGRLHRQVRLKNSLRLEEQGCGFVRFGGSAPDIPLFWRLMVVGAGRGGMLIIALIIMFMFNHFNQDKKFILKWWLQSVPAPQHAHCTELTEIVFKIKKTHICLRYF